MHNLFTYFHKKLGFLGNILFKFYAIQIKVYLQARKIRGSKAKRANLKLCPPCFVPGSFDRYQLKYSNFCMWPI